jgi:PAS domain S-box-containing protein
VGQSISILWPDDRLEAQRILERIAHGESVEHYETERVRKDGLRIQVSLSVSPIRNQQGQIAGAATIAHDVTSRKRTEQALAQLARELLRAGVYNRSLIEASLDPLVTIAKDGSITDVNAAAEKATGRPRQELIGTDFCDYFSDPEKARQGYQQAFREGAVQNHELQIHHRNGDITPVLYNASVYRDEAGAIAGVFAAARDITERKRAEAELLRRTTALERSNADLQQFAYVASHDLQEPLRMVAQFTQLLEERYSATLGETGREFVGYAVRGAIRMQKLIEDLLAFSRVGTHGRSFEPVNCNESLNRAMANLRAAMRDAAAKVSHEHLPTVAADASQMVQLFQNLVGNAIKFKGEKPPRVQVSAARKGNEWVFSVRDNGIGFEPQHAERIFVIFQRLHGVEEYPGTGIGLALCKKIVERHGGRIWTESQPGKGATFFFSIPDAANVGERG